MRMLDRTPARIASEHAAVRILDAAALADEASAWDDLVARALEPHPHYSRHVIDAHRRSGLAPAGLSFVTVWRGHRIDAALPFRLRRDLSKLGAFVARPFLSPFMPSSAPLVAADEPLEETLALLVTGLAEASGGRPWRWPLLTTSGRLGTALLAAMRLAGWRLETVGSFERPILVRRARYDALLKDHPHKGRLKDLRRRQRRLSERGTLDLATATEGRALATAVEAFLALEAAGWKGSAGTALLARPETAAFAREVFADRGGPISIRADTLRLDGKPLAISLALIAGRTAALLKTTYDETERAFAPGLVLEGEIVRALHEDAFAEQLDSATLAGSALESLYPERESVSEIISAPPGGDGLVSLARRVALARFEHRAKAHAKRLLKRR